MDGGGATGAPHPGGGPRAAGGGAPYGHAGIGCAHARRAMRSAQCAMPTAMPSKNIVFCAKKFGRVSAPESSRINRDIRAMLMR